MHNKLMLACMAVAALAAFVITPAASATTATDPDGTPLAVGASVTNGNSGKVKFTGGFGVECEVGHLTGTLTQNNTTGAKGEIPAVTLSNAGGAPCSSALGATTVKVTSKLCWETVSGTDNLKVTGCGANVVFDLTAAGITCKYETASLSGTFTTNTAPASMTISEQPASEVGGLFFCPDTGKWDMTFQWTTTGGTAIKIS
jgi:hypothetical protein